MRQVFKFLFLFVILQSCEKKVVDILIVNGIVYDGINLEPTTNSIAVLGDQIVDFGDLDTTKFRPKRLIDASGMIVSPGFIDPHTHADRELVKKEESHNKPFLFQGITTVITGNDGESVYPISKFKTLCETNGVGTNVVPLTGHGTLREASGIGTLENPSEDQLNKMKTLLTQELEGGAFGISTGLFYSPGSFSSTDEVVELSKIVNSYGGIYDSHIRDESSYTVGLEKAIDEVIEIGQKAKLPVHISHIKCLGTDVWMLSDLMISKIEKAQLEGIDITANQYPYRASATGLKSALIPKWAQSGGMDSLKYRLNQPILRKKVLDGISKNIRRRGGGESLVMIKAYNDSLLFKNLSEIAKSYNLSESETTVKLVLGGFIRIASFNMTPHDIHNFMKQEWVVTGSDGNTGHPRKYGSFPKKFREFVKEKQILSLGQFIKNSTSKTADIFNISNRGSIKVENKADIIIFDPQSFTDKATFDNPFVLSEGLEYSIINGKLSLEKGKFTNQLNGKFLTRN
ncbi:MAG: N-acyl-D-amino-acid deacylase family protein [Polaribacter sp.]